MAGKPLELLDKGTMAAMNFNVLRRIDPDCEKLLATAGHVTLYDFAPREQKWARKGVEGTLFIIRRRSPPLYQYIVLNKKSQDHYVEDIGDGFKFEVHVRDGVAYLLYKNKRNEVVGIWFYDKEECAKVVLLLKEIAEEAAQPSAPPALATEPPQPPAQPPAQPQQHPLLAAMLAGNKAAVGEPPAAAAESAFWDAAVAGQPASSAPLAPDGSRGAKAPALIPSSVQTPPQRPAAAKLPVQPGGEQSALERLLLGGGSSRAAASPAAPQPAKAASGEMASAPSAPAALASPVAGQQAGAPLQQLLGTGGLMRPSFFQQSPAPQEAAERGAGSAATPLPPATAPHTPAVPPSGSSDALLKLFARASGPGELEQAPASPALAEPSAAATPAAAAAAAAGPPAAAATSHHALVRSTLKALANSDEFVQLLVREMQRTGLLQ